MSMVNMKEIPMRWYEGTKVYVRVRKNVWGNTVSTGAWRKVLEVKQYQDGHRAVVIQDNNAIGGRVERGIDKIGGWWTPSWVPQHLRPEDNGSLGACDVMGSPIKVTRKKGGTI